LRSGSVKYSFRPESKPDRLVVTYDHLHDYCTWYGCYGSNTGQAVIYFDGPRSGDIVLGYRSISTASSPIIVGLSPGYTPAFEPQILSSLNGTCTDRMSGDRGGLLVSSILQKMKTSSVEVSKKDEECEVGTWGEWSECDKPCGVGKRTRRRKVMNRSPSNKIINCPAQEEEEDCNVEDCLSTCEFFGLPCAP